MTAKGRGPGVDVPPPVLFVVAYAIAWLLDRFVMHLWPTMSPGFAWFVDVMGWALVAGGVILGYWGFFTFVRMRTPIYPNRDAKVLVIEGPYRFSRNPMYSGIIIGCIGGCVAIHSLWPLVTVSVATMILYAWIIRREERHLTDKFGEQYREYQRQVGRWF